MKKIFFISGMLVCFFSFGQVSNGEKRICSNQFSTLGIAGMTFTQAFDFIGKMHNDYQENLLSYLSDQKIDLRDTNTLKKVIQLKTREFFSKKGIDVSNYANPLWFGPGQQDVAFSKNNYSQKGGDLMIKLRTAIQLYNESNNVEFFKTATEIKSEALNLSNETEVFTVGIPIAISIFSFNYWENNAQRWYDTFKQQYPAQSPDAGNEYRCHIGLGQLGAADVVGAIRGATGGGLGGGPLGAVAPRIEMG